MNSGMPSNHTGRLSNGPACFGAKFDFHLFFLAHLSCPLLFLTQAIPHLSILHISPGPLHGCLCNALQHWPFFVFYGHSHVATRGNTGEAQKKTRVCSAQQVQTDTAR